MNIKKISSPPLGWNSFDSYSIYINEEQALKNLDAFIKNLKPHGYEYFCIDSGWFMSYVDDENVETGNFSNQSGHVNMDEYGRYVSSPQFFPNGLKVIADKCHQNGVKFGLHLMRGMPRAAVENNCKILGTDLYAKDLADFNDLCLWCGFTVGFDAKARGAQEYYNSMINHMCEAYEVDLIKYDDLCDYPEHLELIGNAIKQAPREIFLSQSPGDLIWQGNDKIFKKYCNSIRISRDIWDTAEAIRVTFERWQMWEKFQSDNCFLDLDMIPFGNLLVNTKSASNNCEFSGASSARKSRLTLEERKVFITQRALAASPLIMGGDLLTLEKEDFDLITNKEILACNQNGKIAQKIYCKNEIDIRKVYDKQDHNHGWIGIFNVRSNHTRIHKLSANDLEFESFPITLIDIWNNRELIVKSDILTIELPTAYSVLFIKF